jgi:gas vesicle protein
MSNRVYYSAEAEELMQRRSMVTALAMMVVGLGIGALIAMLFAPGEGEKTRRMVADAIEESYRRGRDATDDALSQLEKDIPNLRKRVDSMLSKTPLRN